VEKVLEVSKKYVNGGVFGNSNCTLSCRKKEKRLVTALFNTFHILFEEKFKPNQEIYNLITYDIDGFIWLIDSCYAFETKINKWVDEIVRQTIDVFGLKHTIRYMKRGVKKPDYLIYQIQYEKFQGYGVNVYIKSPPKNAKKPFDCHEHIYSIDQRKTIDEMELTLVQPTKTIPQKPIGITKTISKKVFQLQPRPIHVEGTNQIRLDWKMLNDIVKMNWKTLGGTARTNGDMPLMRIPRKTNMCVSRQRKILKRPEISSK
jgi:hypothetical protein